ncbi:MAG: hypothetical protein Q9218_002673 [Villophora microphyllina]
MARVLEQTLASKGSHESFHSSHSQPPASPTFFSPSNQINTDLHTAALQAAGLPVVDIEAYLNDPRYQGPIPSKSPPQKKQTTQNTSSSSEPVQLGAPKTSHNVPMLHQLCQERGLVAEFKIDGEQTEGFCGSVRVGEEVISNDQRWPNKKEAKEALAELALPVVRNMEAVKRDKVASGGEQERNWIGMLLGKSIHIAVTMPLTPRFVYQNITTLSTQPTSPPDPPTPNTPSASTLPAPAPSISPTRPIQSLPPQPSARPQPHSPPKRPPATTPPRKSSPTSSPPAPSTPTAASSSARKAQRPVTVAPPSKWNRAREASKSRKPPPWLRKSLI